MMTDDEILLVNRLRKLGLSAEKIAERTGITVTAVRRILQEYATAHPNEIKKHIVEMTPLGRNNNSHYMET